MPLILFFINIAYVVFSKNIVDVYSKSFIILANHLFIFYKVKYNYERSIEYYAVKTFVWVVEFLPNSAIYKTLKFTVQLFFKYEKEEVLLLKKSKTCISRKTNEEIILPTKSI